MKGIMIIIIGIMMLGLASASWNSTLSNGLQVYYTMNESSGSFLNSVNTTYWNLSTVGTPTVTYSRAGKIGTAVNVSGGLSTSFLNITNGFQMNPTTTDEITINEWVFANSTQGSILFDMACVNEVNVRITNTTLTTNTWVMLTLTANASVLRGYINGVLAGSSTCTGGLTSSTEGWMIGQSQGYGLYKSTTNTYGGIQYGGTNALTLFDEIGMWNRSIAPTEIIQLYNGGNGITYETTSIPPSLTTTLLSPSNRTIIGNSSTLSVNSSILNGNTTSNLINITYYIWDSQGHTAGINTTLITGNTSNTTSYYFDNITSPMIYTWNALTCADSGLGCVWGVNQTLLSYITINMFNNGNHITSGMDITCDGGVNIQGVTSPYLTSLNTMGGAGNKSCTFTDTNGYYYSNTSIINFSTSTSEYNITFQSKTVTLQFRLYNGTLQTVNGYYTDGNRTGNFTNTSLIIIQRELMRGHVKIYFNANTTIKNYTQFYSYDNDWITDNTKNITVMTKDYSLLTTDYIKVIDTSGNLIDDALITMYLSKPQIGGAYKQFGQRFSGEDGVTGTTYAFVDTDDDIAIMVTKDGWRPKNFTFDPNSNSYPATSPLTIKLDRDTSGNTKNYITITGRGIFSNRSRNYILDIYAPDRGNIKYTTTYRDSISPSNTSVILSSFYAGKITLQSGTDFSSTGSADITLNVYVDDVLWNQVTIPYVSIDNSKFNEPTGLTGNFERAVTWILLVIISFVLGLFMNKDGESSTGNVIVFVIGCILVGVFISGMGWLGGIGVAYFVLLVIKKVIVE